MPGRIIESPSATAQLARSVLAGERRVVAWGAIRHLSAFAWRAPWPFDYIVDRDRTRWGRREAGYLIASPARLKDENPAHTTVAVLPYGESYSNEIIDQIRQVGDFDILIPSLGINEFVGPNDPPAFKASARYPDEWRHEQKLDLFRLILDQAAPCDLASALNTERAYEPRSGVACLFTDRMFVGGAERQLSYLAGGLAEGGWSVSLWGHAPPAPDAGHYEDYLGQRGVEAGCTAYDEDVARDRFFRWLNENFDEPMIDALWQVPPLVLPQAAAILKVVLERRPEIVVAYQDRTMAAAGIAGLMAGVPRILLSGRGTAPDTMGHVTSGAEQVYRQVYKDLAGFPRQVRFSSNSSAGARGYARWLGLGEPNIAVIHNAVVGDAPAEVESDPAVPISFEVRKKAAPHVLGVFRFFPQKNPLDWIAVIAHLRERIEDVTATLCGDGPMRGEIEEEIRHRELQDVIALAGVVSDLRPLYRRADTLLLTSAYEGLSNVVLEAQSHGLPVVATDSGGTREALYPNHHRNLFTPGDIEGMSSATAELIRRGISREERSAMRKWLHESFSVEKLVRDTLRSIPPWPGDAEASARG